jgi:D-lyxose ketol-isomerase
MKRSEINLAIDEAITFFNELCFHLPPFAYFSLDDWKRERDRAREIFDVGLGWDVTDFGTGDFASKGLLLFTIRNGKFKDSRYPKPYCEKIMIADNNQVTPYHFHWDKWEDIINRGGGDLGFKFYNAAKDESLAETPVEISIDGIKRTVGAGEEIILKPGESALLRPYLYHEFYGKGAKILIGEVSSVNDDANDNRFLDVPRFPDIEEDEDPKYLLCNDYDRFLK